MQISYPELYNWATSSCEVCIEIKLFKLIFSPLQQIGKKKGEGLMGGGGATLPEGKNDNCLYYI
jgi:hypothetical protein